MKRGDHYSTDLLDESLVKARERREEERLELLDRAFEALEGLSQVAPFEEAYIFGSLIEEGAFRKGSDVDVGFLGMRSEDVVRATAYLSRELGFDVDVVQLEGYRFAAKITREGIKWKRAKQPCCTARWILNSKRSRKFTTRSMREGGCARNSRSKA